MNTYTVLKYYYDKSQKTPLRPFHLRYPCDSFTKHKQSSTSGHKVNTFLLIGSVYLQVFYDSAQSRILSCFLFIGSS